MTVAHVEYRDFDLVCRNLADAVPTMYWLSANQTFNRSMRPRMRTMRHVEQALEDLVTCGEIEVKVLPGAGLFRVYRWAP